MYIGNEILSAMLLLNSKFNITIRKVIFCRLSAYFLVWTRFLQYIRRKHFSLFKKTIVHKITAVIEVTTQIKFATCTWVRWNTFFTWKTLFRVFVLQFPLSLSQNQHAESVSLSKCWMVSATQSLLLNWFVALINNECQTSDDDSLISSKVYIL